MKKIFRLSAAVLLAVSLAVSGVIVSSGDNASEPVLRPVFSVKYRNADPGEIFDLYVSIKNNSGSDSLKLTVDADANAFDLIGAENMGLFSGFSAAGTIELPSEFSWNTPKGSDAVDSNGCFLKLSFKVKDEAKPGSYNVSITNGSSSLNGDAVEIPAVNVSVNVRGEKLTGDSDGDGEVSDFDAIILERYLAGWDTLPPFEDTADIDGDGEISDWDATLLCRYLAGWNVPEMNASQGSRYLTFLTSGLQDVTGVHEGVTEAFKNAYSDFAIKLASACGGKDGTLVSPLSVLTAMLMTANGAKGNTLSEMLEVLIGGMSLEEANRELLNYFASLVNTENTSLEDANAVFFTESDDFTVSDDFIDLVEKTYKAAVAEADFAKNETVDLINEWCDDNTAGMIKKVLEYDDVDEDTIMVLLNALCFQALWESQYDETMIRQRVFHGTGGDQAVNMMVSEEGGYIKGQYEEGFVKYYKDGKYAFVALLPDEGIEMEDYLASLENGRFKSLVDTRKGRCIGGIPEFRFDLSAELKDVLSDMGIKTAFTNNSDLSGLGTMKHGENLKIGKVIHKTHIEVDPSGTKAAAVTAVVVERVTSVGPHDMPEVILDRPFVYAIVDTGSMLPIFIGTLTNVTD